MGVFKLAQVGVSEGIQLRWDRTVALAQLSEKGALFSFDQLTRELLISGTHLEFLRETRTMLGKHVRVPSFKWNLTSRLELLGELTGDEPAVVFLFWVAQRATSVRALWT